MATDTNTDKAKADGVQTVTFTIDGRETTVPKGTTVLEAAKQLGIHIPTFCWHPKLKSVGACRMCYVEIEKMPKLQVSCATEAMEGMVVYTDSEQVRQGRKAVIEFILTNHPLDCPTCDKGGECDLQNLTFKHGYDDSRFDFNKLRFREDDMETTFDDRRIGPEIVLNRNRCILCYKCVRANKEAFGEYDLGAFERGNHTEINAAPGQEVDNPYSGNLVEICPVGALTNTDWRYKIRVWLTQQAKGLCPYSSSGINTLYYKERHQQKIFRVTSRPNDDIDDGWLPDVTRYGYQAVMSEDRLQKPLVKKDGKQVPVSWDEALGLVAKRLKEIDDNKGNVCIGGLISPHLDNASLYSFNKFMRRTIGSSNIDHRFDYPMLPTTGDTAYSVLSSRPFEIARIDTSDVIVSFASDLVREHPNEYLRIRKAYNFHNARIFSINPYSVKSADIARGELVYTPGMDDQVINAICLAAIEENIVDGGKAGNLAKLLSPNTAAEAAKAAGVALDDVKMVARALAEGKQVTVLVGELTSRCRDREGCASALCNLNKLFGIDKKGQIARLARYANSKGAEILGVLPHPAPGVKDALAKVWGAYPECEPANTDQMMVQMTKEAINAAIVVGANPIMLYPDREFATEGLGGLDFLVVCDMFETETTALADVVLPLASWAEYAGDYVNLEGRAQSAEQVLDPRGEARPAYEVLAQLAEMIGSPLYESPDELSREMSAVLEADHVLPWPADYREVKVAEEEGDADFTIPLFVGDDPHHCGHWTEKANSLVNFCGEAHIEMSPELAERLEVAEGGSVRVESKVGKIIVPVRVSEQLDTDVVLIPRNFASTPVTSLLMRKRRVNRVKISKVTD